MVFNRVGVGAAIIWKDSVAGFFKFGITKIIVDVVSSYRGEMEFNGITPIGGTNV